ncbi:MAG: rod shape-determining protein MreC [Eubacteriales bacterium]|nr:rod shape-determining protein MreC [Eubacteriales bacterium]MDY3332776.1 rod shape-determining protein MreC [Gallibacter sp.]
MNWLKKHKKASIISFVIAVLVTMILVSALLGGSSSFVGNIVKGFVNIIEKPFVSVEKNILNGQEEKTKKELETENKELKEENDKLREENINLRLTKTQYEEFNAIASLFDTKPYKDYNNHVIANIKEVDNSALYKVFTIDKGKSSNIAKGDLVATKDGIIGFVSKVNDNDAKVTSILNINQSISFVVSKKENVAGVLNGDGSRTLEGYLLDDKANVVAGDIIVTSGRGIFPKGIVIGRIDKVNYDADSRLKRVRVKPKIDFTSLSTVVVCR